MRERVRELVAGARASIEAHRHRIDDLNVYPVPDGDTGTNLTLTVRAIERGVARGVDGRARQLRRDPLPDRARRNRFAGRVRRTRPGVSVGERRGLPGGEETGRGDDADRDPRAG